jgi:formylglycine-generating enzyme required for sulfatase activity
MKKQLLAVLFCVLAAANFASADALRGNINMDFVTIGNAGNAADTQVMNDGTTGYGAVDHAYRIGKYEVTNAQWNAFTAAAGAPTGNDGGYGYSAYYTGAQQPTDGVSWYEAAQFCNFLTSGDKSKGAYQFSGDNINPGSFQGINRALSTSTYGTTYVIPTEDEWYKAAYFKSNASGYSLYANGTNTVPVAGVNSNYNCAIGSPWTITNGTPEQNGTFDMMGNVWEWNEALVNGSHRGIRGGAYYYSTTGYSLASSSRGGHPYSEYGVYVGFRVASIVPEPASALLMLLGAAWMGAKRKR